MLSDVSVEVLPEEAGRRLDQMLLARFPSSTRAFCRQAIAEGAVSLNGHPVPKGMKVASPDSESFVLYVPESWQCDVSSGASGAYFSDADTSSVSVTLWSEFESSGT